MEPKAATERDEKIRESRRCRSSDEEEDPDEVQRGSKRSKLQTWHHSSPHRRTRDYRREEEKHRERGHRDYRREEEMHRERGNRDYRREEEMHRERGHRDYRREEEMHRERGHRDYRREEDLHRERGHRDYRRDEEMHRGRGDRDYRQEEEMHRERGDRDYDSPYHHTYDRSSRRYDDDRSIRRRHDDSPQEDRNLRRSDVDEGHDGGEDGPQTGQEQDVSEEPLSAAKKEKPTKWLMLDNLFDKFVVKPFDDSFTKIESVLLADVKAYAHEICATKGGTVVKIHVDPYSGSVYVRFRYKCFAAAAMKAMKEGIYYNETRLIKATYIDSDDHRVKFVV